MEEVLHNVHYIPQYTVIIPWDISYMHSLNTKRGYSPAFIVLTEYDATEIYAIHTCQNKSLFFSVCTHSNNLKSV